MTSLFSRPPGDGPHTHAFVIGVGGYPAAKTGAGSLADLVADDVPSAVDSAKYFCDWLLRNRDTLVAPLATLEVLLTDTNEGEERFVWEPPLPADQLPIPEIDLATSANVIATGISWLAADRVRDGDEVLFYFCGHGASLSSEPTVFLSDLNANDIKPWSFINVHSLGRSLRQNSRVGNAYLFVDACGETIPGFDLHVRENRDPGTVFWKPYRFGTPESYKVLLLCATPSGTDALDGAMPNSQIRLGRFTQTLVKALNGALVADWDGRWAVDAASLTIRLKNLKEFYFPGWNDHPFEPGPYWGFNEFRPIVVPNNPVVPIKTRIIPNSAFDGHSLCICDLPPPPVPALDPIPYDNLGNVWRLEMTPNTSSRYAVVHKGDACFFEHFRPDKAHFDLKVKIP